jgi:hypothetical protein
MTDRYGQAHVLVISSKVVEEIRANCVPYQVGDERVAAAVAFGSFIQ